MCLCISIYVSKGIEERENYSLGSAARKRLDRSIATSLHCAVYDYIYVRRDRPCGASPRPYILPLHIHVHTHRESETGKAKLEIPERESSFFPPLSLSTCRTGRQAHARVDSRPLFFLYVRVYVCAAGNAIFFPSKRLYPGRARWFVARRRRVRSCSSFVVSSKMIGFVLSMRASAAAVATRQ